jgi:hypothetical protein
MYTLLDCLAHFLPCLHSSPGAAAYHIKQNFDDAPSAVFDKASRHGHARSSDHGPGVGAYDVRGRAGIGGPFISMGTKLDNNTAVGGGHGDTPGAGTYTVSQSENSAPKYTLGSRRAVEQPGASSSSSLVGYQGAVSSMGVQASSDKASAPCVGFGASNRPRQRSGMLSECVLPFECPFFTPATNNNNEIIFKKV